MIEKEGKIYRYLDVSGPVLLRDMLTSSLHLNSWNEACSSISTRILGSLKSGLKLLAMVR